MPDAQSVELAERLFEDGDISAAERVVAQTLEQSPRDARALHLAARIERMAGRPEAALQHLEQAVDIDPGHLGARLEMAALHGMARDLEAARDELQLAVHYHPDNAEPHFRLGVVFRQRGEDRRAIESLNKAIELDPAHAEACTELGYMYVKSERFQEALEVLERAVQLDPLSMSARNSLGYAYVRLEEYERALEVYSQLCAKLPRSILGPRINLGNSLDHTGRVDEAEQVYNEILAHEPNHYGARWNRAHNLLARGDFEHGWEEYRYRLQDEGLWHPRLVPFAPWKGEPLDGKAVVVTAEQGLGDQIMFASCLEEITRSAARVLFECDRRLVALFQRSFPRVEVVGTGYELVPAWLRTAGPLDYHIMAGSMPGFVRRGLADFPAHSGYLRADAQKVARWRAWLDSLGPGLKIGLSWRGGTVTTRRRLRSLALEDLLPLLRIPGFRFVSLQYGDVASDLERLRSLHAVDIAHAPEAIADYDETAALCVALDLTVSVCTSVIHLNGALGKPVWVMVPAAAEWRYGRSGERMPWYPAVRLVRQPEGGDWSEVIARLGRGLQRLAEGAPLSSASL